MPHLIIDYSANMETRCDIAQLCDHMRRTMLETGVFPEAGIRVRAFRANHCSVADGDNRHGYIDMQLRIGAGRNAETRAQAAQSLFDAASDFLDAAFAADPLALSLSLEEITSETSHKRNSIRTFLGRG